MPNFHPDFNPPNLPGVPATAGLSAVDLRTLTDDEILERGQAANALYRIAEQAREESLACMDELHRVRGGWSIEKLANLILGEVRFAPARRAMGWYWKRWDITYKPDPDRTRAAAKEREQDEAST